MADLYAREPRRRPPARIVSSAEPRVTLDCFVDALVAVKHLPRAARVAEAVRWLPRLTPADRYQLIKNENGNYGNHLFARGYVGSEAEGGPLAAVFDLSDALKQLVEEAAARAVDETEPCLLIMPGERAYRSKHSCQLDFIAPAMHPAWSPLEDLRRVTLQVGNPLRSWTEFPFTRHLPAAVAAAIGAVPLIMCTELARGVRAEPVSERMLLLAHRAGFSDCDLACWQNGELFRAIGYMRDVAMFDRFYRALGADSVALARAQVWTTVGAFEVDHEIKVHPNPGKFLAHVEEVAGRCVIDALRSLGDWQQVCLLRAIASAPRGCKDKLVFDEASFDFYTQFGRDISILSECGLVADSYASRFQTKVFANINGLRLMAVQRLLRRADQVRETGAVGADLSAQLKQLTCKVPDAEYVFVAQMLRLKRPELLLAITDGLAAVALTCVVCSSLLRHKTEADIAWLKVAFGRLAAALDVVDGKETFTAKNIWTAVVRSGGFIELPQYEPVCDSVAVCPHAELFGVIAGFATCRDDPESLAVFAMAYDYLGRTSTRSPQVFANMHKFVCTCAVQYGNDSAIEVVSRLDPSMPPLSLDEMVVLLETGAPSRYVAAALVSGPWAAHADELDRTLKDPKRLFSKLADSPLVKKYARALPLSARKAAASAALARAILEAPAGARAARVFWAFPEFQQSLRQTVSNFVPSQCVLNPELVEFLHAHEVSMPLGTAAEDCLKAIARRHGYVISAFVLAPDGACDAGKMIRDAARASCWDLVQEIADSGQISARELEEFRAERDCVVNACMHFVDPGH